ncbi:MAG: hypothetical protein CL759_12495 [Chloroflexi bacterium]|nr:hypothetical protein [Chloroflexota bacterium]
MTRFWRNNSVTAAALFLESCALYLAFRVVAVILGQSSIILSFGLVILALVWSFILMSYVLSVNVNPRLRGLVGLGVGVPSLLFLANLNTGFDFIPFDAVMSGRVEPVLTMVGTTVFLLTILWRGASVAKEEITLEAVRSAFLWGLAVLFFAALVDRIVDEAVVNGFLVVGFFSVGLLGLSLARFSSEIGETHVMSGEWMMPILVSVGGVVLVGLVISAIGLGGLDDVTRGIIKIGSDGGFWILRPILLVMGAFAGVVVSAFNWMSGVFGGGDFSALINAQEQLEEFHRGLREQSEEKEPSTVLVTTMKWVAFGIAVSVAGWVVYKLFRSRRFTGQGGDVEETRESLFTWGRANDDISGMLAGWWKNMFPVKDRDPSVTGSPTTPREFYHGFLGLSSRLGRQRKDWETPNEHQRVVWGLLPTDPVYRIVQRFQRSHSGQDETDQAGMDSLQEDWRELNEFMDREDL